MVRGLASRWLFLAVLGSTSSLFLVGCGKGENVQEALGYEQTGPDEMAVIRRPPLIVPPDYNLRPPRQDSPASGSKAASDAARETLIGPSSSLETEGNEARAILTGETSANGASNGKTASEGQDVLISRTNRTELNLDELTETRAENRVDSALLRRLLAWTPEDRPTAEGDNGEADEAAAVVQVVSRSQTVIEPVAGPDQESTE